jgi:hypothetical protein
MRLARFCNNPACELLDVLLPPRQALRKGGREACPRCLEPLVVRPARPRPRLRKRPPAPHHLQETAE